MLDIALLRKTLEWAEEQAALPEHESAWCQDRWHVKGAEINRTCGTAYCIAGKIVEDTRGIRLGIEAGFTIPTEAAAALGVPLHDVWNNSVLGSLFSWGNAIVDVRCYAEALAEKYGERL